MRAFVLGNGPSLNDVPFDRLKNEFTIGMNRIHLMIHKNPHWMPSVYVKTDHNPALRHVWARETLFMIGNVEKCYLWDQFATGYPADHPNFETMPYGVGDQWTNVEWVPRCEHHHWAYYSNENKKSKAWHLPEFCTAYSGIGPAMQAAVKEGADEIFLLGADLGYGRGKGKDHFDEEYDQGSRRLGDFDTFSVLEAHKIAKASCPIPIYNATPGSKLDLYPKVDLMEIL